MSAHDVHVSRYGKEFSRSPAAAASITVPVPVSYSFISYFLESAPATRMEFSGRHKSCRGRQNTPYCVTWQDGKGSSYLVSAESNHTLVSSICWCKYVGRIGGTFHPMIKSGKLKKKISSLKKTSNAPVLVARETKALSLSRGTAASEKLQSTGSWVCRPPFKSQFCTD